MSTPKNSPFGLSSSPDVPAKSTPEKRPPGSVAQFPNECICFDCGCLFPCDPDNIKDYCEDCRPELHGPDPLYECVECGAEYNDTNEVYPLHCPRCRPTKPPTITDLSLDMYDLGYKHGVKNALSYLRGALGGHHPAINSAMKQFGIGGDDENYCSGCGAELDPENNTKYCYKCSKNDYCPNCHPDGQGELCVTCKIEEIYGPGGDDAE